MKNKLFINLFVAFAKLTGWLPAALFLRPKVYRVNKKNKKIPKPAILVSNHKSLLDFVLYLVVFPFQTIHFLMAEVLYNKGKLFSFMLNSLGGIRVERESKDFGFVSNTLDVLDHKGVVGIFPEGRLPINNKPWPFTTSTAFIAMRSDAKILPVYTDGTYLSFKRARVCIGEPFVLSDYAQEGLDEQAQLTHLTKVLEEKVYELKTHMEAEIQRKAIHRKHTWCNISMIAMDMARLVCSPLVPILRIKRITPEGQPYRGRIKGGAIIAANHTSFLDPFVVGVTFWYRRMYMLVAEVVMAPKLRRWLLRGAGAIRIDRNKVDLDAINTAIDKLKNEYLLTVFPQGAIKKADEMDSIKSGAVLIALRAKVPIIPMYIQPGKRWYQSQTVVIGEAIDPTAYCTKKFPSTADIQMVSDVLIREMNRCRDANISLVTE